MMGDNKDWSVVKRCLNGDRQAYALLVEKYNKPVFNIVYRLTGNIEESREITQETFLKAYKSLNQARPEFKFSNWLFKIATNICWDQLKKKKIVEIPLNNSTSFADNIMNYDISDNSLNPEEELIVKEQQEYIQKTIESLPFIYRRIIVLRYIQNLTYKEIADISKMPMGRVKVQLYRAHKILNDKLADIL